MRRIALVLCVVGGLGLLLFPTAGTPATQQTVETDDLQLSPSTGPNRMYVTQTLEGEYKIDLTRRHPETGDRIGLNEQAVTTIDELLRIEYTEPGSATVWLETPTPSAYFYSGASNRPIDSRATGIELSSGEAVVVGLLVDTGGQTDALEQFDQFEVNIGSETSNEEDTEEVPVETPPVDEPGDDDPDDEQADSEPDLDTPDDERADSEPDPGTPDDEQADSEPDPGTPDDEQAESPDSPPSNPVPNGSDSSKPSQGLGETADATGSDPPPELGATPDSTQVAIGGLRWVLLLVAGGIVGLAVAATVRRLSMQR